MRRRAPSPVVLAGFFTFFTLPAGLLVAQGPALNPFVARFQRIEARCGDWRRAGVLQQGV